MGPGDRGRGGRLRAELRRQARRPPAPPGTARPDPAHPDGVAAVVSERPRHHVVRRRAGLRPGRPRGPAAPRRFGLRAQPPVSRRSLPERRGRGCTARDRDRQGVAAMKVGIVGLPNAGKSSLFSALTGVAAEAANYPFTTIEPNVAIVPVTDERLDAVARTIRASKVVPDTIAFHDIAGLVAGAP